MSCRWLALLVILALSPMSAAQKEERLGLSPQAKTHLTKLLKMLQKWPLREAKQAAAEVISVGRAAEPLLLLELQTGTPASRAAAAYCLGEMRASDSFEPLVQASQDPAMKGRLLTLFAALVKLDRQRAYPTILPFLQAPSHTLRYPAFTVLYALTKPVHLPLIKPLLQHRRKSTRHDAVALLEKINTPAANQLLLKALADPCARVAFKAAKILGARDDPTIRQNLVQRYDEPDKRLWGYIILTLVLQEDRFHLRLFTDEWLPVLLEGCRHDDYFIRGCAAVGIANVGYYTDNAAVVAKMDKFLVPIFIETIVGQVYFKDYSSLRHIVYKKLTKMTGQYFGFNKDKWWRWWSDHGRDFKAPRLIKNIAARDVRHTRIHYSYLSTTEPSSLLFSGTTVLPKTRPQPHTQIYILTFSEMVNLLDDFKKVGFLKLKPVYGKKGPNTPCREITLYLNNQRKVVQVYGHRPGPFHILEQKLLALAKEKQWQHYWDRQAHPQWESWLQENEEWFRQTTTPLLRQRRLKRMILTALSSLEPEQQRAAALHFKRLMEADPHLPDYLINLAVAEVRRIGTLNRTSTALIQGLAKAADLRAVVPLIRFLHRHYSLRARELMLSLLAQGGRDIALRYLMYPDWRVKSAAAEVLWRFSDKTVILHLVRLLNDSNANVKSAAIISLSKIKGPAKQLALEPIKQSLHDPDPMVRKSAIMALPKIAGDEGVNLIIEFLRANEAGIRRAVLQALGQVHSQTAVQTLIASMCGDHDPLVREAASLALAQSGTQVIPLMVRLACQPNQVDARVMALQTLGHMNIAAPPPELVPLLQDEENVVRQAAALLLARWSVRACIPVLIDMLTDRRHGVTARRALERITFVSFHENNMGLVRTAYQDWWRLHGDLPTRQWFFDALKARGYDVTELIDYVMEIPNKAAIPVLLNALHDQAWFIRAGAVRALSTLTGQSFGDIHYYTGQDQARRIIAQWEKWWHARKSKRAGQD